MEAALDEHSLLDDSGRPVVVSVSGGLDSVALLHCLWHVADSRRLQLHVLHFNHRLRPEAEHEEALGTAPPHCPNRLCVPAWEANEA
jgi:tRNA(Ile)-lysidine synthase